MNTSEKLIKTAQYAQETVELNNQLEQILYGTDTGGKSFYDEFWDSFQENGNRTAYTNAFSYGGWTDEIYNPKYTIKPTSCNNLFAAASYLTDTKVDIDLTDTSGSQKYHIFSSARKLKTIRKLIVPPEWSATGCFDNCISLENLTIEGTIGKNNFNVQWSTNLSGESIVSIIEALSSTTSELTVTLSQTAVDNIRFPITSEQSKVTYDSWETLIATKSNWTISLV